MVTPEWLYYFVRQENFRWDAKSCFTGTAGQLRVPASFFVDYPFPLPPLPEQERIVARIEELFTQLEAGVAALKRVQAGLRRYRAAVLKAACEGRLAPQQAGDEPAEALLRRLGKAPVEGLGELPEGWCWATVDQLASSEPYSIQSGPFGSDLHHSEFQESGVLAIGIDNVLTGKFSLGKEHRISFEKYSQLQKFTARPMDVLITVMATVGRCCVVPKDIEKAIITKHVYRISVDGSLIDPYYFMFCLWGGEKVRFQLFQEARGQTRLGINGTILKSLIIPLPPLCEQKRIVSEVDTRLSVIDPTEQTVEKGLLRVGRLRQAVLKAAFSGNLI